MKLKKTFKYLLSAMFLVSGLSVLPAAAAEGDKSIGNVTCKDVMQLVEERAIVVAFLHGYLMGKSNTEKFNSSMLEKATDKFIDHCLDHPKEMAVKVMAVVSK